MIPTYIDVKVFNVIRYAITSLLFVPCLEWALQNIVESFGTKHLLRGGIVRWGGVRLGRLSSKKTRLLAIGAGLLIHATSLLGEFGFGATQLDKYGATNLFGSCASAIPTYIGACNRTRLNIKVLTENKFRNITETFNKPEDCWKSGYEDLTARDFDYKVLNKEVSHNINAVSSNVKENIDLDWKQSTCPQGANGTGTIHYKFTVIESEVRKYGNLSVDLPISGANTTLHIPYVCHSNGIATLDWPSFYNLENVGTLRDTMFTPWVILKQNNAFSCLGTHRLQGFFCFSNADPSIRKLYRSVDGFHRKRGHAEAIYLFAEFEPPVDVSRMYFILSGIHHYPQRMHEFNGDDISLVREDYNSIGSVLTILLAMPSVLAPQGSKVRSVSDGRFIATIDNEALVYLVLLTSATLGAVIIACIYNYTATRDSGGRVVKVLSEPKYVIDLVANDILGNEDCAVPSVTDFGIALTSHDEGRYHICIDQEGIAYKGGIVR